MRVVHAKLTNKQSWAQTVDGNDQFVVESPPHKQAVTIMKWTINFSVFTFHFHFTNEQNTLHEVLKYYTYPQILCQEKRAQDMASPFMDCTLLQDLGKEFLDGLNGSVLRDHLHCLPLQNIHRKRRNLH